MEKGEKKMHKELSFAVICLLLSVFSGRMVQSAETQTHVHNLDTGLDYMTIQQAIDAPETLDKHTILVGDGNYTENIKINKPLTIRSENGPENCRIVAANFSDYTFEVIADNVTITGFTIASSDKAGISLQANKSLIKNNVVVSNKNYGIYATSSSNSIITNNTIGDNLGWGIYMVSSSNNTIGRNNLLRNDFDGLYFWSSNNNVITNNFLDFNLDNGLYFWYSNYNVISNNTLYGNRYYNGWIENEDGIYLHYSNNNMILNNLLSDNDNHGIWLVVSSNNTIAKNVITKNHIGISVPTGSNNLIYLNNFIDNENSHSDSSANTWNSPSPIPYVHDGKGCTNHLGNYWSDYEGTDHNSGSYQNITGSDGIGDEPYVIDDHNTDRYPLMEPWIPGALQSDLNNDETVNILDITIVAIAFGSTPEDPKWNIIADLNNDQIINILDISTVASEFRKTV